MAIYGGFTIDGTDLAPYVKMDEGMKPSKYVVNGPNAGRTLSGTAILDVITEKHRVDIVCRELTSTESHVVLGCLSSGAMTVSYEDPEDGYITISAYCASWAAGVKRIKPGTSQTVWSGVSFSLVEI